MDINPFEVFNIKDPNNFNILDVRNKFKNAVKLNHPDKGGNKYIFNLLVKSYKFILNEYEKKKKKKKF